MGRSIRDIQRSWPLGTALPQAGIFFFYDPATDAEYKVLPEQLSGYLPIAADHWGVNDPPQALLTVNAALEYLHARGGTASPTTPASAVVDAQRQATLTPATGDAASDYEYQFRAAPTVSASREVDLTQTLAAGETAADYEYQFRAS